MGKNRDGAFKVEEVAGGYGPIWSYDVPKPFFKSCLIATFHPGSWEPFGWSAVQETNFLAGVLV